MFARLIAEQALARIIPQRQVLVRQFRAALEQFAESAVSGAFAGLFEQPHPQNCDGFVILLRGPRRGRESFDSGPNSVQSLVEPAGFPEVDPCEPDMRLVTEFRR